MRGREAEHFDRKGDKKTELCFTDIQKTDIKKVLKRGIYRELYDRDFLSATQLNELLKRNA